MFRGLMSLALDEKGRMAIPARYRDLMLAEGHLVVTIDTEERCLLLYPASQWEAIERKLESLPSFHPVTRRIQRLLIGHATDVEMDRGGRILVPPLLRDYAGLDKVVMLVGQGKKFELWSESQWNEARMGWLSQGLGAVGTGEMPQELSQLSL